MLKRIDLFYTPNRAATCSILSTSFDGLVVEL